MQSVALTSGNTMPEVGLGLWQIKNEAACIATIKLALSEGYRHFDTAQFYGNEAFLGKALAASKVSRKDLFVTTKIWNENMWWVDLLPSFEESLQRLQTDYVDLLLLHFPVTELRRPAWKRMEEVFAAGTAKSIGVSNYTIGHLKELLRECSVKPAVNQVELHVYLQQPELLEYCKQNDIVVEAYSPLAHGYGLDNPTLAKIGKQYGKSPAQVMLRWCLDMGTVPLPKSVTPARLKENIDIFDFALSPRDLQEIAKLNSNYRTAWDPTHVA